MRLVLAAAAVLAVGTLAGCSGADEPAAPTSAKPTPIEQLNTAALELARTSFCTRLPEQAVNDAVGGKAGRGTAWRSGDKAEVAPGVDDVVHEFGCRWTKDDTTARAWVFARPIDATEAQAVIAKTSKRTGCTSSAGPDFGNPSQRQVCQLPDGGKRIRVAGLIGETWLSCEISAPAGTTGLSRRTDAWCVAVANAANTSK